MSTASVGIRASKLASAPPPPGVPANTVSFTDPALWLQANFSACGSGSQSKWNGDLNTSGFSALPDKLSAGQSSFTVQSVGTWADNFTYTAVWALGYVTGNPLCNVGYGLTKSLQIFSFIFGTQTAGSLQLLRSSTIVPNNVSPFIFTVAAQRDDDYFTLAYIGFENPSFIP